MASNQELGLGSPETSLSGVRIEIIGKGAYSVGASLNLKGLVAKHTHHRGLVRRDSEIIEDAMRLLRGINNG